MRSTYSLPAVTPDAWSPHSDFEQGRGVAVAQGVETVTRGEPFGSFPRREGRTRGPASQAFTLPYRAAGGVRGDG